MQRRFAVARRTPAGPTVSCKLSLLSPVTATSERILPWHHTLIISAAWLNFEQRFDP